MVGVQFIIWVIIIFGLAILVHEVGHFLVAKSVGIKVEEFGIGFGKMLVGKKVGETLYRINIIPYGGYVKLLGQEEDSKDPRSYTKKPLWAKAIVLLAGVFMNCVLAVGSFYAFLGAKDFVIYYPIASDYNFIGGKIEKQIKPFVAAVAEGTPAADANFPDSVIIWKLNDIELERPGDLSRLLAEHKGEEVAIEVMDLRGKMSVYDVQLRDESEDGILLGIQYDDQTAGFYKLDYTDSKLLSGFSHSINVMGYNLDIMGERIASSFETKTLKPVSESVYSVVGFADTVLQIVKVGELIEILNLLAALNLSLAMVNVLPIPVLDGGVLLFEIIAKIRGKKLNPKIEDWVIRISFGLLILLAILITIKDIIQFDIIARFANLFKNLF